MASNLGALTVSLALDSADFVKGISKSEYEAQKFAKSVKRGMEEAAASVAGLVAAFVATGAISTAVGNVVQAADALNDLSEKTGLSVDSLSAFQNAAKLSGSSAEGFNDAIVKFSKGLASAASGADEQAEAFKRLGVSVVDSNGKIRNTKDVLLDVSDAFSQVRDGAAKIQYATAIGGKSFADMIPFLNQGRDSMEKFNASIGEDFSKEAARFNDNIDKMKIKLEAFIATNTNPLLKSINDIIEGLDNGGLSGALLAEQINLATRELEDLQKQANNKEFGFFNILEGSIKEELDYAREELVRLKKKQKETYGTGDFAGGGRGYVNPDVVDPRRTDLELLGKGGAKKSTQVSEAEKYLEQLEKQTIQVQNLSREEQALAEIESGRLGKVTEKQKENILNAAKEIDNIKAKEQAQKDLVKATEEEAKWLESVKAKTEIGRVEEQAKEVERLNKAYEDGKLTYEVWQQALVNARKGTDESIELNRKLSAGLAQSFADGFADAILEAKSFSDVLSSVAVEVQRLIIKMMVIRPLQKSIEDGFNNSGGLSGIFSSIGSSLGGSTANSGGYENLSFAGGGYTGNGSRSGGVDGMGGFPAILHPNETVVDHAMGQTLGGSNVTVNVINNSGSQVSQTRRDNADGSTTIDVMIQKIEEGIASNVAAGTGAMSGALAYRYGLQAA